MDGELEAVLLGGVRGGDVTCYHAFVTGHMGLVYRLAGEKVSGQGREEYEELVGEGGVALCEAAWEFGRRGLGCRFSTYAYIRVSAAMVSWQRCRGLVRGTEWGARRSKEARGCWGELDRMLGEVGEGSPTREEVGEVYGGVVAGALGGEEYVGLPDDLEAPYRTRVVLWDELSLPTRVAFEEVLRTNGGFVEGVTGGITLGPACRTLGVTMGELCGLLEGALG